MILDEAIKHAEEVAEEQEKSAKSTCKQCAEEHRQLAEWPKELKMYRERIPLASNQEPKMGYWIIKDGKEQGYDIGGAKTWYVQIMCDKCGFIKTAIEGRTGQYKFCPNCGQPKMRDAEE